jgi:hypothetical protein
MLGAEIVVRMPPSGMWRRVDLVRTDISDERVSIFRVEKIRERKK